MNNWLRILLRGETFFLTAFGVLMPIFALFLVDRIPNVNLLGIGIAEAMFLISLGILRPFTQLSTSNDARGWRTKNLMFFGVVLAAITPFLYLLARDMMDVYVIQILYGVGIAFCEPAWERMAQMICRIETRAEKWQPFNATGSLVAGGLAIVGGFIAQAYGMGAVVFMLGLTLAITAMVISATYLRLNSSYKKI